MALTRERRRPRPFEQPIHMNVRGFRTEPGEGSTGEEDELLPVRCSEYAFAKARWPKVFYQLPGGRHTLDEVADDVHRLVCLVCAWLMEHLDCTSSRCVACGR